MGCNGSKAEPAQGPHVVPGDAHDQTAHQKKAGFAYGDPSSQAASDTHESAHGMDYSGGGKVVEHNYADDDDSKRDTLDRVEDLPSRHETKDSGGGRGSDGGHAERSEGGGDGGGGGGGSGADSGGGGSLDGPTRRILAYPLITEGPEIDWNTSLGQCQWDLSFLLELLTDFHTEGGANIRGTLEAANAYFADLVSHDREDFTYEMVSKHATAIQKPAHALKGCAANLYINSVRLAAQTVEGTLKIAIRQEEANETEREAARKEGREPEGIIPNSVLRVELAQVLVSAVEGRRSPTRDLVDRFFEYVRWAQAQDVSKWLDEGADIPPEWEAVTEENLLDLLGDALRTFERYEAMFRDTNPEIEVRPPEP